MAIVEGLRLSLYVTHPFVADLAFYLTPPGGGTVLAVISHVGGDGDNFGTSTSARTVLSDAATIAIESGTAPFVGEFRPSEPLNNLNGLTADGTWSLRAEDWAGADVGTLVAATLFITVDGTEYSFAAAGTPAAIPDNDPVGVTVTFSASFEAPVATPFASQTLTLVPVEQRRERTMQHSDVNAPWLAFITRFVGLVGAVGAPNAQPYLENIMFYDESEEITLPPATYVIASLVEEAVFDTVEANSSRDQAGETGNPLVAGGLTRTIVSVGGLLDEALPAIADPYALLPVSYGYDATIQRTHWWYPTFGPNAANAEPAYEPGSFRVLMGGYEVAAAGTPTPWTASSEPPYAPAQGWQTFTTNVATGHATADPGELARIDPAPGETLVDLAGLRLNALMYAIARNLTVGALTIRLDAYGLAQGSVAVGVGPSGVRRRGRIVGRGGDALQIG